MQAEGPSGVRWSRKLEAGGGKRYVSPQVCRWRRKVV